MSVATGTVGFVERLSVVGVMVVGPARAAPILQRVTTFERESRTGVEPRWGCRALELGSYKGIRYKGIVRLRKTEPNKED